MTSQTVWQEGLLKLLELIASVVMVILPLLVRKYIKNKEMADLLDQTLTKGVAWAEEQGRKALNDGMPLKSETKLEMAVDFVIKELEALGATGYARDKLVAYIEAKLSAERASPTGVVPSDTTPTA